MQLFAEAQDCSQTHGNDTMMRDNGDARTRSHADVLVSEVRQQKVVVQLATLHCAPHCDWLHPAQHSTLPLSSHTLSSWLSGS